MGQFTEPVIVPMALTGSDGNVLAADVHGDPGNPPVLLLHGGGQTRRAWRATGAALARGGWRAWTVDQRGHGQSQWVPAGGYRLYSFANDVAEVATSFEEPPILVGSSLGGLASLLAVAAAADQPAFAKAIVLVDVAPRVEPDGRARVNAFMASNSDGFASMDEVAAAVQSYRPDRPGNADISGLAQNVRQRADGRFVWHWDPLVLEGLFGSTDGSGPPPVEESELRLAAKALTIPTLLVRGGASDVLSEAGAQDFLELVPHASYADVAGATHMVAGDRNDEFSAAVLTFAEAIR